MDWGQIGTTPKFPTWSAKFHYYRTHHPIIMGFGILGCMSSAFWVYMLMYKIDRSTPIKKYKDAYFVYRPDDPHVKIIKKGPIGLDWFDSK